MSRNLFRYCTPLGVCVAESGLKLNLAVALLKRPTSNTKSCLLLGHI